MTTACENYKATPDSGKNDGVFVLCWLCHYPYNDVSIHSNLHQRKQDTRPLDILPMMNCVRCGALLDRTWIESLICGDDSSIQYKRDLCISNTDGNHDTVGFHDGDKNCNRTQQRSIVHMILGYCMAAFVLFQITGVMVGVEVFLLPDVVFQLFRAFAHHSPTSGVDTSMEYNLITFLGLLGLVLYTIITVYYLAVVYSHPGKVKGSTEKWHMDVVQLIRDLRSHEPPSFLHAEHSRTSSEIWTTATYTYDDNKNKTMNSSLIFIGYRWCEVCQYMKPSNVHHCSRCGTCIHQMDHHCIYAGNKCIGSSNMEYFIQFLNWILIGSLTSCVISILYAWCHWPTILRHTRHSWGSPGFSVLSLCINVFLYLARWLLYAELIDAVWLIVFITSSAASIGLCLLLSRQISLRCKDTTWLEELRKKKDV